MVTPQFSRASPSLSPRSGGEGRRALRPFRNRRRASPPPGKRFAAYLLLALGFGGLVALSLLPTAAKNFGPDLMALCTLAIGVGFGFLAWPNEHDREARDANFFYLADISTDWVWETDAEHRFAYFNSRWSTATGHDRKTVLGRTRFDMPISTDDPKDLVRHRADLDAHRPFRNFVYVHDQFGRRRHIRISGFPIFAADGAFRGYRGIGADVTAEVTAKRTAEQARQRLFDAINGIADGFLLFDADDRLVLCNQQTHRLALPKEALTPGITFAGFACGLAEAGVIPAAAGRVDDWIAERIVQHRAASGVQEYETLDGQCYRVIERRTGNGDTVCVYSNITALKQRELQLAEQSTLLTAIVENMADGMSMVDAEGRLIGWNRNFLILFGIAPEKLTAPKPQLGDLVDALPEPQAAADLKAMIQKSTAAAGKAQAYTFEHTRPNGATIEVRGNPVPGGGFVTIYTDITERKRAEIAVRESEERYRQLVELMPDAIGLHRDGVIIFANSAGAHLFGEESPDAIVGRYIFDLLHPSSRELARQRTEYMLKHSVSRLPPIELLWRERNGGVIPVETATTCFYEDGHPIFITVGRDVRKQRQHEAELRAAKEEAECANRAKTEFLATMSHELRTPLNAVIGFSEIMSDELFGALGNPRYVEYAANIRESGQHLLSVINDILDLSKAEAGKLELREEEVDLAETINSSCRLLHERATQAGVTLNNRIASLPVMRVDQRMIKQILLNLLTNAIKFSPAGGSVELASSFNHAGDLLLTVADTGIGLAEEDIPRALQAFGQVDSVLTRKHEGTGLGLPLCKTLAELHGGALAIESEVGRGTAVTVTLPRDRILT